MLRELRDLPKEAGLNRVVWDLHFDGPRLVALRTTPPENPHIWDEPRFDNAESRPITHWGIEQAGLGPIAAPGKYTVRLTVDGQSYTQPLEILLPPDSHGTEADIQASVRLQTRVRDDLSSVSDMTNQIEWLRKKLEDDRKKYAAQAELIQRVDAIDQKLQAVEYQVDLAQRRAQRRQIFHLAIQAVYEFHVARRRDRFRLGRCRGQRRLRPH